MGSGGLNVEIGCHGKSAVTPGVQDPDSKQRSLLVRTDKILADEVAHLVEHVGGRLGRGLEAE